MRCCGGGGVQLIRPLVRFRVTAFRSPGGADGISSRVCTCSYASMNIDMDYKDGTPTKRQVSKRQVSKRPVSKRLKRQVYKTIKTPSPKFRLYWRFTDWRSVSHVVIFDLAL